MTLKNLVPMLNVSNIENSLQFYSKALGFDVVSPKDAVKEWRWATIRSGNTQLMLSESDCEPNLQKTLDPESSSNWPTCFYFYPDDVAALYTHVKREGFTPTELQTTVYGMTEFSLRDPDGHFLSFGQDADEISQ